MARKSRESRNNYKRGWMRERLGIYGIGSEQRHGVCPLCLKESRLLPDHDHVTGHVRDWICNSCNLNLGLFEKREADGTHQSFRDYLKRTAQ